MADDDILVSKSYPWVLKPVPEEVLARLPRQVCFIGYDMLGPEHQIVPDRIDRNPQPFWKNAAKD